MRRTLLLLPLALLATGGSQPETLVFAAASLTESLQSIARTFETRTGRNVAFSFGASSDLARQIQAGAPADVFFSADTEKMDALETAGLVRRQDRREFLSNSLVVVVPASSRTEIRSPADLGNLSRLAVADPAAVPAGIYAKKWLSALGLWEKLEARVIPTLDVRAALAAVESESVPAAIVYRTDAAISKAVRVAYVATGGPEILYSLAPLAQSKNRAAAEAFVALVAGPEGRAQFLRRGFLIRDAK